MSTCFTFGERGMQRGETHLGSDCISCAQLQVMTNYSQLRSSELELGGASLRPQRMAKSQLVWAQRPHWDRVWVHDEESLQGCKKAGGKTIINMIKNTNGFFKTSSDVLTLFPGLGNAHSICRQSRGFLVCVPLAQQDTVLFCFVSVLPHG